MLVLPAPVLAVVESVLLDLDVAWLPLSAGGLATVHGTREDPSMFILVGRCSRGLWLSFVVICYIALFHVVVWVGVFLFLFVRRNN